MFEFVDEVGWRVIKRGINKIKEGIRMLYLIRNVLVL